MKKIVIGIAMVLLFTTATQLKAAPKSHTTPASPVKSVEIESLLGRLNEIKGMDMSALTRAEKRELRKEVQSTKEALRRGGYSGFYISGGAIIIIVLLILLL
jgi:hypothetical protein